MNKEKAERIYFNTKCVDIDINENMNSRTVTDIEMGLIRYEFDKKVWLIWGEMAVIINPEKLIGMLMVFTNKSYKDIEEQYIELQQENKILKNALALAHDTLKPFAE